MKPDERDHTFIYRGTLVFTGAASEADVGLASAAVSPGDETPAEKVTCSLFFSFNADSLRWALPLTVI